MTYLLKRKKSFTLLEILLAFSVLSMILAFIFQSLRSSAFLNTKCDTLRQFFLTRYHTQERLSQIFSKIEPCVNPMLETGESAFYTSQEPHLSLHFTFDNGIDPEEAFTGMVQGHLFISKNTLVLEITPIASNYLSHKRQETLLQDVQSLSFIFYKRPSLVDQNKTISSKESFERLFKWPLDYPDIPYCMTLSLQRQDKSLLEYSFYLSSSIQPISFNP